METAFADIYTETYRLAVERHLKEAEKGSVRMKYDGINAACYAWLLAEKTGEARYRRFALARYDRFLDNEVNHDFHLSRPFGLLTWKLHQAGELTGQRRERARDQAKQRTDWFLDERRTAEEYFDCNIALADTLAVDCLARSFADDPKIRRAEIQRSVANLGKRILEVGDLNENASNYSSLGICFFVELAHLEGWMDEVADSEAFRNMFARQREIISPAGRIPEFGDGYFRWDRCRLDFACLLEIAARLYDDTSFLEAAAKVVPGGAGEVEEDQLFRGYLLLTLPPHEAKSTATWPENVFEKSNSPSRRAGGSDARASGDGQCPLSGPEGPTLPKGRVNFKTRSEASIVLHRRLPGTPVRTVPDKLILRTGREPGDAMVMIDLYAEGSHAHRFKRPSVGYYETAGVPLFHNLGRRGTRSGQCGNSFWIWEDSRAFPGYPQEDEWNIMTVPATYCLPADEEGTYRIGRDLLLRNFGTGDLKTLRLDNLRLEGPRGTLLLDGFESPRTWHGNVSRHPDVKLESSPDRTQGEFSQQVNWHIFGSQYCTRLLEEEHLRHTTFRLAEYDAVKLDYKYEGQHPHCNLRSLFRRDRWVNLGNRALECTVVRAESRQIGKDAWGAVDLSDYNGPGNGLGRRIVLTREGVLVIVDTFTPSPRAHGWAGGQLWQLYTLRERGDDWFASESDGVCQLPDGSTSQRRMLVKFMATSGTSVDVERVRPATMHAPKADGTKHHEFYTTYSKQNLSRGETATAAMVVLPLKDHEDGSHRAAGISFEEQQEVGTRVTIALPAGGQKLTVTIRDDNAVVQRHDIRRL